MSSLPEGASLALDQRKAQKKKARHVGSGLKGKSERPSAKLNNARPPPLSAAAPLFFCRHKQPSALMSLPF
jgi:hypothetical protein